MSERTDLEGPNYRERLDITQVFLRQRDRTNFAASVGGDHYASYVRQTMRLLPLKWQQWVMDQADRYNITKPVLMFKMNSNVRMGRKNDPLIKGPHGEWGTSSKGSEFEVNRHPDGSVDWSDPRIVSPYLIERTETDYEEWDKVISEASEYAGISWQEEKPGGDGGDAVWVARERSPYVPSQEGPE